MRKKYLSRVMIFIFGIIISTVVVFAMDTKDYSVVDYPELEKIEGIANTKESIHNRWLKDENLRIAEESNIAKESGKAEEAIKPQGTTPPQAIEKPKDNTVAKEEGQKDSKPTNETSSTEPEKEPKPSTDSGVSRVTSKVKNGLFKIDIPKMGVYDFYVQRGVGDEQDQLEVGGSLHSNSPLPSTDKNLVNNALIGAHRVWFDSWNPFFYIDKMQTGDKIYVYINGTKITYVTYLNKVIRDYDLDVALESGGGNEITLYSCEIFKGSKYRVMVKARME